MPSQRIPCSDCADKKEEIELTGEFKVTSCDPIPDSPGWCLITYERVSGSASAQSAPPAAPGDTND